MIGEDVPEDETAQPAEDGDRLQRIAQALGRPVRSFFERDVEHEQVVELLQLWDRAATPDARRKILACARRIVGQQGRAD